MYRRLSREQTRVFIEGDDELGDAFRALLSPWLKRLKVRGSFRVIMGGPNFAAAREWRRHREGGGSTALLIIDSEGPTAPTKAPLVPVGVSAFLTPSDVATGDVYFMVQLMEAWFLVGRDAVAGAFGKGFRTSLLPEIPGAKRKSAASEGEGLETIEKSKVLDQLDRAAKGTRRGGYERHSGKIQIARRVLSHLDLRGIARVSFHARRLVERLDELTKDEPKRD